MISVGNLTVGGAGKTPVTAWLVRALRERGRRPAVLHGGYAADEPALHRNWAPDVPVMVERDRVAGARAAIAAGADVLVLDDGFQHRRLHRDLDLVLVAAEQWDGAARLLPRGPMREPVASLRRATLVAVTRRTRSQREAENVAAALRAWTGVPILQLHLRPRGWLHGGLPAGAPDGEVLAVAAIADPGSFAANAGAAGAAVGQVESYPDHHEYRQHDAQHILAAARGRMIVTTEKDWMKLRALLPHERVWVLTQQVDLESGGEALEAALARVLA